MDDNELWDMSDEELESAYKEAVASAKSPDTDIEEAEPAAETEEFAESESPDEDTDETVELDNELEENGAEQTESEIEASDHDASEEDETEEVAEDDTTETDVDNPDGDAKSEEEESSKETDKVEDEPQPARSYAFKANGKDYEFSSDEIVDQFPKIFGKAMDYTKKMQAIKPWRKTIDAMEDAKLNHADVSLMIDVLKGDKDAITEVLKRTGTDTLELDTEADSGYEAKDYGRDEGALAISDIVDEISKDTEYTTTHNILSKEWDEKSWNTMAEDPNMIKLLHEDVKSGMYGTLQPIAEKLKVFDGGTKADLDYYKLAAQQHFSKEADTKAFKVKQDAAKATKLEQQTIQRNSEAEEAEETRKSNAKAESSKRVAAQKASAKRKAAAPTKSASATSGVTDYLDESDESFDAWYKNLQDSM